MIICIEEGPPVAPKIKDYSQIRLLAHAMLCQYIASFVEDKRVLLGCKERLYFVTYGTAAPPLGVFDN